MLRALKLRGLQLLETVKNTLWATAGIAVLTVVVSFVLSPFVLGNGGTWLWTLSQSSIRSLLSLATALAFALLALTITAEATVYFEAGLRLSVKRQYFATTGLVLLNGVGLVYALLQTIGRVSQRIPVEKPMLPALTQALNVNSLLTSLCFIFLATVIFYGLVHIGKNFAYLVGAIFCLLFLVMLAFGSTGLLGQATLSLLPVLRFLKTYWTVCLVVVWLLLQGIYVLFTQKLSLAG